MGKMDDEQKAKWLRWGLFGRYVGMAAGLIIFVEGVARSNEVAEKVGEAFIGLIALSMLFELLRWRRIQN